MKVALIHDYLNQYGGAERVLENLMEIFPNAPVYTLLYDKGKTLGRFEGKIKQTSFLDFPLARKKHRWFLPFMPLAAQTMTIDHDYDLVISDSAGYAKGISIKCNRHGNCNGPKHISYIHTPLRYAWEQEEYLTGVISNWQLATSKPLLNYLKRWDYKVAQRPDTLIANSQFIAGKVKKYYGREAKVIHPPVDTNKFYLETSHSEAKLKNLKRSFASAQDDGKGRYYLAVGRLLHYKRFDLVIDAFAKLGLPLKIVGSGQESTKLQEARNKQQATNIEFVPFVKNEDELRKLYNGAKALVFPQVEDFGLVAAEAQACGTPVIAYAAGGATEIVEDGKGGILFKEQTPESLIAAVRQFEKMGWDRREISDSARRFSKNAFRRQFMSIIKEHS